ncbi:MAG: Holliday junction branch migration protein RuvA [Bacteroidota bacterium]
MIAFIQGNLVEIEPTHALIECHGIGYEVKISLQCYNRIRDKKTLKLHTFFQVREDAQILYGFDDKQEKWLFEKLIGVSGVGGNTALMILSGLSSEELLQAISVEDTLTLKRIKGIGAKTAARIVLELKDKLKDAIESQTPTSGAPVNADFLKKQEALTALTNLGLPRAAMEKRIGQILKEHGGQIRVEDIIKLALKNPQ